MDAQSVRRTASFGHAAYASPHMRRTPKSALLERALVLTGASPMQDQRGPLLRADARLTLNSGQLSRTQVARR